MVKDGKRLGYGLERSVCMSRFKQKNSVLDCVDQLSKAMTELEETLVQFDGRHLRLKRSPKCKPKTTKKPKTKPPTKPPSVKSVKKGGVKPTAQAGGRRTKYSIYKLGGYPRKYGPIIKAPFKLTDQASWFAQQRATRFFGALQEWKLQKETNPQLKNVDLVPGKSTGQSRRSGKNPQINGKPTEQAHFVQLGTTGNFRD